MVSYLWQDAIHPPLIKRLLRPLVSPGVIPDTLAVSIFERSRQFKQRLSLFHQFQQRWGRKSTLQLPDVPIVYAQWVSSIEPAKTSVTSQSWDQKKFNLSIQDSENISLDSAFSPLVVQAKFENPLISTSVSEVEQTQLPLVKNSSYLESSERIPTKIFPKETQQSTNPRLNSVSSPLVVQAKFAGSENSNNVTRISSGLPIESLPSAQKFMARDDLQPVFVPDIIQQDGSSQPLQDFDPLFKRRSPWDSEEFSLKNSSSDTSLSSYLETLPLVPAENFLPVSSSSSVQELSQPLVLARRISPPVSASYQESSRLSSPPVSERLESFPLTTAQTATQTNSISTSSPSTAQPLPISINRLTQQVERTLMRKITVERERRGQQPWH